MKKQFLLWKTLLKYTLWKQKDSLGIVLIIAMVTAMVLVVTGVTGSIKNSYIHAMNQSGEYDYKIINMSKKDRDIIWQCLRQKKYTVYQNKTATVDGMVACLAQPDSVYQTELCGYSGAYEKTYGWKLEQGKRPETTKEILLDERYNKSLEIPYKIGDTISLYSQMTEKEYRFTICGFMKSTHNSNFEVCTAVTEKAMEKIDKQEKIVPVYHICVSAGARNTKEYVRKIKRLQKLVCDVTGQKNAMAEKENQDKVVVGYNENKAEMMEESETFTGTSVFSSFDILAAFIGFSSLFVVYTVLQIATEQKIRIYGTLRSMGLNKKQLLHTMFWNHFGYYVLGIIAGTILGMGMLFSVGKVLLKLLEKGFPTAFDVPYEVSLSIAACLKVYGLMAIVLLFSSVKIIGTVSKMKPVQAMRFYEKTANIKIQENSRLAKKNVISFLARRSMLRNKGKSVYTFLSLFLSIVTILVVVSYLIGVDWKDTDQFKKNALCDYEVDTDLTKQPEMKPQVLDEIRKIHNVDTVYPAVRITGEYAFDWKNDGTFAQTYIQGEDTCYITIKSYPDKLMKGILKENSVPFKKSRSEKSYYVVATGNPSMPLKQKNVLELKDADGKKLKIPVTAYLKDDTYDEIAYPGYEIICSPKAAERLIKRKAYNIVFVKLKESDGKTMQQIQDILLKYKINAIYTNTNDNVADAKAQLLEILGFALYAIFCILLMSFVNIACTVKTNVNLRKYEYGMMMALGMKIDGIKKMLISEVRILYLYAAGSAVFFIGVFEVIMLGSLGCRILYILLTDAAVLLGVWLIIVLICKKIIQNNLSTRIRNNFAG